MTKPLAGIVAMILIEHMRGVMMVDYLDRAMPLRADVTHAV